MFDFRRIGRATVRPRVAVLGAACALAATGLVATVSPASAISPSVPLGSLGPPTVSAHCTNHGSYSVVTASHPATTLQHEHLESGARLAGAACLTTFTWRPAHRFARFSGTFYADLVDSGPPSVGFLGNGRTLRFHLAGKLVKKVVVTAPVHVTIKLSKLKTFAITMPSNGSDAHVLDLTAALRRT